MAILTHNWWESKIMEPLSDKVKHISHRSKPFHSKALTQEKWKYLSTDLYVDFIAHSFIIVIKCKQFKSPSTVNEQQEILVYLHNRPLLRTKTINYWYTQQPRWISKDLVSIKKRYKRQSTMWFYSYDIPKTCRERNISVVVKYWKLRGRKLSF